MKGAGYMKKKDELLFKVVENFLFYRERVESDNPIMREAARVMCDVDIREMWMFTQDKGWDAE